MSTNRATWRFPFTVRLVLDAARAQEEHHQARLDHYQEELGATEAAIRATGITLDEYQVTGGAQFQAKVDVGLAAKYQDLRRRRDDHERDRGGYAAWVRALSSRPDTDVLELDVDDVRYFRL